MFFKYLLGYADKDVYVCESRYNTKNRWFKKIKVWEGSEKEAVLVPRDVSTLLIDFQPYTQILKIM